MRKSEENLEIGKLYESILVEMDSGDVFGDVGHEASLENDDSYARGDNRYPYLLGIQTRNGKLPKKSSKKKKKFNSPVEIPKNLA